MVGELFGNYRALAQLGEGGMGVVYLAEHTLIGRKAAIKVLRPELSSNTAVLDRFFNEARAAAHLKHPGIIDIFDFGYHSSGAAYITMEFLEGESLAARIRRVGALPFPLAVEIARQAADALAVAHEQNIVHRDLKPDNIFLLPSHELPCGLRVKVLDFGIAKLGADIAVGQRTRTGLVLGTPAYMSPEQCRGARDVDLRTDIYALGCVMFEMACGQPPFTADEPGEIMAAHMRDPAPLLERLAPSTPAEFCGLVAGCLAKDPTQRPQTMLDVERIVARLAPSTTTVEPGFAAGFAHSLGGPTTGRPSGSGALAPRKATAQAPTIAAAVDARSVSTLGNSAGEQIAAPAPWRIAAPAVAVAVVLAAFGTALVVVGRRAPAPGAAPALQAPILPVREAPRPPPPPLAVPAVVQLRVDSEPPGAEVRTESSDDLLGVTPFTQATRRATGIVSFRIHLGGYEDGRLALDSQADGAARVVLRPVPQPPQVPAATTEPPSSHHAKVDSSKGRATKGKGKMTLFGD